MMLLTKLETTTIWEVFNFQMLIAAQQPCSTFTLNTEVQEIMIKQQNTYRKG